MSIWVLVFLNCIQFEKDSSGLYPVKCQVIYHKDHFQTKKACTAVKKGFKDVDSSCVKVTVWRK